MTPKRGGVAGTFDRLHDGHKQLLLKAAESQFLIVGLTSDALIQGKFRSDLIQRYDYRKQQLCLFLDSIKANYEIVMLNDGYGTSITDPDQDALYCSLETKQNCMEINKIRSKNNLKPLELIAVPLVMKNNEKISSSSLRIV